MTLTQLDMSQADLATAALIVLLPLLLAMLCRPLLTSNGGAARPKRCPPLGRKGQTLDLTGQWLRQSQTLQAGIDRQMAAMRLHRQAAIRLGALDHELTCLKRETRAIVSRCVADDVMATRRHALLPTGRIVLVRALTTPAGFPSRLRLAS